MNKTYRFILGAFCLILLITIVLPIRRFYVTRNLKNYGSISNLILSASLDCEAQPGWVRLDDMLVNKRDFCYEQKIDKGDYKSCFYYKKENQIGECLGKTSRINQSFQCDKGEGTTKGAIRKSCIKYLISWIDYSDSSLLGKPWLDKAFTKEVLYLANGEELPYRDTSSHLSSTLRIQANAGKLWNCRYDQKCDGRIYKLDEFMDCAVSSRRPKRLWGNYYYIFISSCRLSNFGVEVKLMKGIVSTQ